MLVRSFFPCGGFEGGCGMLRTTSKKREPYRARKNLVRHQNELGLLAENRNQMVSFADVGHSVSC